MPVRLLRSHRLRLAIMIVAAYWAIAPIFPAARVAQYMTVIVLCLGIGVLTKYSQQVLRALLEDDAGPRSQLAMGIFVGFFGLVLALTWSTTSRVIGAEWMRQSHMVGFYLSCYAVAAGLHITARRNDHAQLERADILTFVGAVVVGVIIATVIVWNDAGAVLRPMEQLPAERPEAVAAPLPQGGFRSFAVAEPPQMTLYGAEP